MKAKGQLCKTIMDMGITPQQIEQDTALITVTDNDGRSLSITPSVIAATLAHQKPHWASYDQREQFYDRLLYGCKEDLAKDGLLPILPSALNVQSSKNRI